MATPKKIKKTLNLSNKKYFLERREELLDKIQENGTFLPKSVLHADLDRGMLDYVKGELRTTVSGTKIPTVDIITTTQNWSQFTSTWDFQNLDKNIEPPFIATVRQPEVKYGTNPSTQYTPLIGKILLLKYLLGTGLEKEWIYIKFHNSYQLILYNVKYFVIG